MAAMMNRMLTTIAAGAFPGTHLTAFDTVDQGRGRVPLETSRADNSLWRERARSDGFCLGLGAAISLSAPRSTTLPLYGASKF